MVVSVLGGGGVKLKKEKTAKFSVREALKAAARKTPKGEQEAARIFDCSVMVFTITAQR
jgi:hypothetical protein